MRSTIQWKKKKRLLEIHIPWAMSNRIAENASTWGQKQVFVLANMLDNFKEGIESGRRKKSKQIADRRDSGIVLGIVGFIRD